MTTLRLTESAMEKAITKPQELQTLFHTNTAHLNKLEFLISSLVKISRLETGVIKLSPSYQTIGDTILMALENIVLAADQKNIQITFNYSEDFNEYSCAVTPQVRQTGNRLSGLAGTAYASLLT